MGDRTGIEWTDASWSPVRARDPLTGKVGWHCEHATPGCANCYAEKINLRLGTGYPFIRQNRPVVETFLDDKMLTQPLRWRRPRKIFVCSMTDLFADFVPDEWIDRVFAVMALAPQHTFQVLTKRAARMRDYICTLAGDWMIRLPDSTPDVVSEAAHESLRVTWPLPNVWLGVSVEDQARADERIPDLLATPAAVRFLSCEPLLGPVDLRALYHNETITDAIEGMSEVGVVDAGDRLVAIDPIYRSHSKLDWVIGGGESGPGARPCDPQWARKLRDDCAAAHVAFFWKQWGAWHPDALRYTDVATGACPPPKMMIGKKKAGRLLDGHEHNEFPA